MWKQFLNITINAVKFKWIRLKTGITFLICPTQMLCPLEFSREPPIHRYRCVAANGGKTGPQIETDKDGGVAQWRATLKKKVATHLKFGHRAVNLLWLYHKLVSLMWKSGFSFEFSKQAHNFLPGWLNECFKYGNTFAFFVSRFFLSEHICDAKEQCTSGP